MKQRTIKKIVSTKGLGLHSGKNVTLRLRPAPSNTGIIYIRSDLKNVDFIPNPHTVRGTQLCTQIFDESNKYSISTVEHLNAALSACGIDNIIVEVDNIEIPIMDGSSLPFMLLIQEAGIEELDAKKQFILPKKELKVDIEDKYLIAKPNLDFSIDFTIDFTHPFIKTTNNRWLGRINTTEFLNNISRARTFGFLKDIEYLQSQGMCLGGSLDSAIVLNEYTILNSTGLRYPDEFVRHKVLDLVGDLFVIGKNVLGHFVAYKSGHELNNKMLREIELNSEILTFNSKEELQKIVKNEFVNSKDLVLNY